jgi:hypothetical protein
MGNQLMSWLVEPLQCSVFGPETVFVPNRVTYGPVQTLVQHLLVLGISALSLGSVQDTGTVTQFDIMLIQEDFNLSIFYQDLFQFDDNRSVLDIQNIFTEAYKCPHQSF